MKKFNTCEELYDFVRAYHGGTGDSHALGHELYTLSKDNPEPYFGEWGMDYGVGVGDDDNLHWWALTHSNMVDGCEYEFYFFEDGSDTIYDDEVDEEPIYERPDLAEEAFDCFS